MKVLIPMTLLLMLLMGIAIRHQPAHPWCLPTSTQQMCR